MLPSDRVNVQVYENDARTDGRTHAIGSIETCLGIALGGMKQ